MKLRAQILIEVEAEDFLADYDNAHLEFREVRSKTPKMDGTDLRKMRRYTGNLHQYAD
jgi:hypothetical protein